jgi:hypothetical protein
LRDDVGTAPSEKNDNDSEEGVGTESSVDKENDSSLGSTESSNNTTSQIGIYYYCPLCYPAPSLCTLVLRIYFCSKKKGFLVQIFKSYLGNQYGTFFVEKKRKLFYSTYVKLYYFHFQKKLQPRFAK